jgi:hypothetical protein
MSKKTTFIKDEEHFELFEDVVFCVEANHHEQHEFWSEYHYEPKPGRPHIKDWVCESMGHMITIGHINDRPICVEIYYHRINGKRVLFYHGCSQLVDHKMISEWLDYCYYDRIKWEMGRMPICDSWNFHNCLGDIGALDEYRAAYLKEQEARKRK